MSGSDPSYTVFIRLPFPRGDFVDPPSVSNPPASSYAKLTREGGMGRREGQGFVEDPLESFKKQ